MTILFINKGIIKKSFQVFLLAITLLLQANPIYATETEEHQTQGLVDKISNKISNFKEGMKNQKELTAYKSYNDSFEQIEVTLNEFDKLIKGVKKRSSRLIKGEACGVLQSKVFSKTALAVRKLASAFQVGGDLVSAIESSANYITHQVTIIDANKALPSEDKIDLTKKYNDQLKLFSEASSKAKTWSIELANIEANIHNQQYVSVHYCNLGETKKIMKSINHIFKQLSEKRVEIKKAISALKLKK